MKKTKKKLQQLEAKKLERFAQAQIKGGTGAQRHQIMMETQNKVSE